MRTPKQGGAAAVSEKILVTCDHVAEYKLPPAPVGDSPTAGPPTQKYVGQVSRINTTLMGQDRMVFISSAASSQLWVGGYDVGFLTLKQEVQPVPYNMGDQIRGWFARLQAELGHHDLNFGTKNRLSLRGILEGVTSCEDSFWYYPYNLTPQEQLKQMFPEPAVVVMAGITGIFRVGLISSGTADDGLFPYPRHQMSYGVDMKLWDFRFKIHWCPDDERFKFSEHGDSGSLVWIVRGDKMYPFAILTNKGRPVPSLPGGEEHWGYATGLHMAYSQLAGITDHTKYTLSIHGRLTATF